MQYDFNYPKPIEENLSTEEYREDIEIEGKLVREIINQHREYMNKRRR